MTLPRPGLVATAATVAVLCLCWFFWYSRSKAFAPPPSPSVAALGPVSTADTSSADDLAPTLVNAHNLLLRKGPNFRIYIRWIRGQMVRTRREVNPSFDDPESFLLQIQKGVIHANIGDISNYLNSSSPLLRPMPLSKTSRFSLRATDSSCTAPYTRSSLFPLSLSAASLPLRMVACGFTSQNLTC